MFHSDCLKYAHKNGCVFDEHVCHMAVLNGRFECLKYACENECPIDVAKCIKAVKIEYGKCKKINKICERLEIRSKHQGYFKESKKRLIGFEECQKYLKTLE